MVGRKLLAAQKVGPRVAVAAHDGRTAVSNRLTQTPAGGDEPGGGGVMEGPFNFLALQSLIKLQ